KSLELGGRRPELPLQSPGACRAIFRGARFQSVHDILDRRARAGRCGRDYHPAADRNDRACVRQSPISTASESKRMTLRTTARLRARNCSIEPLALLTVGGEASNVPNVKVERRDGKRDEKGLDRRFLQVPRRLFLGGLGFLAVAAIGITHLATGLWKNHCMRFCSPSC